MKKLLVVQPELMHYREAVWCGVSRNFRLSLVTSGSSVRGGGNIPYSIADVPLRRLGRFKWQVGLVTKCLFERFDIALIAADLNYISSIVAILVLRAKSVRLVLHGQGVFKVNRYPFLRKLGVYMINSYADFYLAYAPLCRLGMIQSGCSPFAIASIQNRLESVNVFHSDRKGQDWLFVGRLRAGCGIEELIEVFRMLRKLGQFLHIVGSGPEFRDLVHRFSDGSIVFHGEILDEAILANIASTCSCGIYPGAAGLSVLNYMRFGLPVVVGANISMHMGPEPALVQDGYNGWLFDQNNEFGLINACLRMSSESESPSFSRASLDTFRRLHSMKYSDEIKSFLFFVVGREVL